jgi:methylmalonyl-CoA/ethylmalonyl-CoA epimerase
MVRKIHHINFIVRDLEAAVPVYERILGQPVTRRDHLSGRGVDIARFELGDTWLILVQPVKQGTEPARFLDEHGEGFFLLSFDVESVADAAQTSGVPPQGPSRDGLDDWHIQDLDLTATFGAQIQYCEHRK